MGDDNGRSWSPMDVEQVRCCLCSGAGTPRFDVPPFAVVECPRCSLTFTSPRLHSQARQRLYDDPRYFEAGYLDGGVYGRSTTWSPAMVWQRLWAGGRLDLIDDAIAGPPDGRQLLEVGSAFGLFLEQARDRGFTVTGVELSATAVDAARDRLGSPVHHGDIASTGLPGRYDVICAWDTIEHVPDPVAFCQRIRELLTPEGIFAFSTPYVSSVPAQVLGRRWWTLKPAEHLWHFTPRTHAAVLAAAGLNLTRVLRSPLTRANLVRTDSLVGIARPVA